MAAITADQEQRISDIRSRQRQRQMEQETGTSLLINIKTGRLFPNVPLVFKKPDWRPYHGDPNWPLEKRMEWVRGTQKARRVIMSEPQEPFDLARADKEQIIAFALEEFGVTLNPAKPLAKLREEVANMARAQGLLDGRQKAAEEGEDSPKE